MKKGAQEGMVYKLFLLVILNLTDFCLGHLATYVYNQRKTSRNPSLCSI